MAQSAYGAIRPDRLLDKIRARLSFGEYRAGLRVLPELLRFGLKATPGQLAQGISQQGGVWAIGTVAPVATVGAYLPCKFLLE